MGEHAAGRPPILPLETYAALVEGAPVGVYIVQDGTIVYGNRWLEDYSGYRVSEEGPLDALAVIHPEDRPLVVEQMRLRLTGGAALPHYPVRFLRRDGSVRTVVLSALLIEHRGRPAIQGSLVDVTARADAERQLQETADRLEQSNRERRLFGDIVSHDLLNPVWVAENYLRIALDEPDGARARSFLEGARAALEKTRGILLDARTYLRLQEPRDFRREPQRAAALVESAVKGLQPLLEAKRQRLALEVPPELEVEASPLLREVVANLVGNAARFAPPETEVRVAIRPGPPVRLEVGDRGPGVPADSREQIFQRFERIEKGAIQGVGLGLVIARRVVELHGGRIWVEDNPGGGSLFVAELPA